MAVSHSGAISFGMVHIPVGLYTATQDNDIHFNQLCKEDGSCAKYKKVCTGCGKEISWVLPQLVCTVKYMMKTESGSLRQPVFKGLREDKTPEACKED